MLESLTTLLALAVVPLGALLLSPDGDGGGGDSGDAGSSPDSRGGDRDGSRSGDDGSRDLDRRLANAKEAEARLARKAERLEADRKKASERAERAEGLLAEARKVFGDDADATDDGTGDDALAKARKVLDDAAWTIIETRFELEMGKAGFDDKQTRMLFHTAQAEEYFTDAEVSVRDRKVSGLSDVVARLKKEYGDMLKASNGDGSPGAEDTASGSGESFGGIDLQNVQPGEITRLYRENPEEFDKLTEDLVINTGQVERRTGKPLQFLVQRRGSPLNREIQDGVRRAHGIDK